MSKNIRRIISTAGAPKAIGPYSQAVLVNELLFCSGQLGLDPATGEFVADDAAGQTQQALKNAGAVLEAAGTSFRNVVKTSIFLADINDYKAVNEVYAGFFAAPYPARAAFQVATLPKHAKVEIELIAIVGEVEDQ